MKANQLLDFFAQRIRRERKSFCQDKVRSTPSAELDNGVVPEAVVDESQRLGNGYEV